MKKSLALKLQYRAEEVAKKFSNFDREKNHNNETFELVIIRPLSDYTAAVIYEKDTGKRAIAFFYYVDSGQLCVADDSHHGVARTQARQL